MKFLPSSFILPTSPAFRRDQIAFLFFRIIGDRWTDSREETGRATCAFNESLRIRLTADLVGLVAC